MWNVPLSSGSLQPDIECYGQLTVPRAQLSTHRVYVFFEVFRWQVTIVFNWSQAQILFFQRIANVLCLWANSRTINFWSETDFKREKSVGFYRQGRQLLSTCLKREWAVISRLSFVLYDKRFWLCLAWSHVGHALRRIFILDFQNLTGEFKQKIHAVSGNLAEAERALCHLNVFNRLFLLDLQNEMQLLKRFFCYPWLVSLSRFWLRNAAVVNRFQK